MAERPIFSTNGDPLSDGDINANFEDVHPPLNPAQIDVEASRCLFCYDAPCITACPTAIDIPKFIRQMATDNMTGAAKTILSANIMGGTCARVCPTEVLCEQKCVLNAGEDAPIKIGALQRSAVDYLIENHDGHPFERAPPTGKLIAVIGAGPAGLACAHALAKLGHSIRIYEAKPKPGGLNEYGLAPYKMVDDFAAREVQFILGIGSISIHYNKALGRDVTLDGLRESTDAVFIGIGLSKPRWLGVEGEDLPGVSDALGFIEHIRQAGDLAKLNIGNDVVIIGGGNTAIDASVQAKRLGAKNVTLVYRRGAEQMGATIWEQELAAKNGVMIRHWASPVRICGQETVTSVRFDDMQLKSGKLVAAGEPFEIKADQVLKAIGQQLVSEDLSIIKSSSMIMHKRLWQAYLPAAIVLPRGKISRFRPLKTANRPHAALL